jgi:CubicO group peptidase (beta-lactamase class C family)
LSGALAPTTMKTKLLFTILSSLLLFSWAHAQAVDKAKLDRFLDQLFEKNQAMGELTIVRDGELIYDHTFGFGQMNGGVKQPLTAASRFRIGSITKMFTAIIIYQLAEEKRLNLADKLAKFAPEIPNATKITIAHILGHRSGIHNVFGDPAQEPWRPDQPISKADLLVRIAKGPPDFEPGTMHRYSNSGYSVLGFVIERVTGKAYEDIVKERISSRVGLNDTYVTDAPIDVAKGEALTYRAFADGWRQSSSENHPTIRFAAGSIVSTTADMAKFMKALFDGKLISPESLETMKTQREGEGMGMAAFTWEGRTFYGESGGDATTGAWVAYLPEEKLAIAYATNAKVYSVSEIMKGVAAIYYNRPFEIPAFEKIEVSPETLEKYIGVYVSPPARFTITREGSTLHVQPASASKPAPMEAKSETVFQITKGVTMEFDTEKGQMTLKRPQGERVFTREK